MKSNRSSNLLVVIFIVGVIQMSFISNNTRLSLKDMQTNATYIYNKLSLAGWSDNAIAGVLGNLQTESSINPGRWEGGQYGNMLGGYGLVQWTPATNYTNWADAHHLEWGHMDSQLARIQYEMDNGLQWYHPTMSFYDFSRSDRPPYELAMLFLAHYERPADPNQPQRGEDANYWYEYITGLPPPIDGYDPEEYLENFFIFSKQRIVRRRNR